MAGPTWYEILGVEPTATPEQIKAAWRAATDKFEPGSGQSQFRLFNEAADVLLDPERRREYDAEIGVERAERGPTEEELGRSVKRAGGTPPEADHEVASKPSAQPDPTDESPTVELAPRRSLLLPVLAALTGVAVVAAIVFGVMIGHRASKAGIGFFDGVTNGDALARADAEASAGSAAERALAAALSYDYRRLSADKARAVGFMTRRYGKQFGETFDKLLTAAAAGQPNNVVKTKTVVKASVLAVGAMNPGVNTTDKVRILAYVDQTATKGGASPTIFQNRVAVTLVKQHGAWLIDGLTSY